MAKDKNASGDSGASRDEPPKSTGVNRTDAEGIDSFTQPGAATGESEELQRARALVAQADAAKERFGLAGGRAPHVLKSNLDVRRGDQVHRIPAGSVITDTDLTDDEWDTVLRERIAGEATVSELQAHQVRLDKAASDEREREERRKNAGVAPKDGRGTEIPKGAVLVTDLSAAAAETRAVAAAQAALVPSRAIGTSPASPPLGTPATPEQLEEARRVSESLFSTGTGDGAGSGTSGTQGS